MFDSQQPGSPSQSPGADDRGNNASRFSGKQVPGSQQPAPTVPVARQVHSMPGKFLSGSSSPAVKKGNRKWVIIIAVLVVILLAGGTLVFLRFQNSAGNTNVVTNTVTNQQNTNATTNLNNNGNTNVNANANTNASVPTIVKGSVTDVETNEKISTATLTIPGGALPTTVTSVAITALSADVGAYAASVAYQAVGGVYLLTPSGTTLSKDATLEITYTDSELLSLGFVVNEQDLTMALWKDNEWSPVNTLVDTKTNTGTTEIAAFHTDGVALVVPKPAVTNTNTATNTNTSGGVVPSLDSDADGLTNQEEILYGTNAGGADTDLDSFKDGQEVLALYNPNGTGTLEASALVRLYENTTYNYSLLYPPSWTVGTLNADKLVTFTSITGEFVQVSVQENAAKKSAREWYLSLNPSVEQTLLRDVAVGSLTGVLGPDGLNVYLADSSFIYQITYNIGIKTEANYLTTFTMMYSSFTAGIPSSTNTNTNTNSTNGNTNSANTNGG